MFHNPGGDCYWEGELVPMIHSFIQKTKNPLQHHWLGEKCQLVGGFNPFEKYESNWIIPPGIGMRMRNV